MIVESPAKARKIGGYLGDDYIVEASIGHIRDLPQRAADIPKEVKKFPWSREGVDIENGFAPLYVCLLYTSPSPRDGLLSRMPSSA